MWTCRVATHINREQRREMEKRIMEINNNFISQAQWHITTSSRSKSSQIRCENCLLSNTFAILFFLIFWMVWQFKQIYLSRRIILNLWVVIATCCQRTLRCVECYIIITFVVNVIIIISCDFFGDTNENFKKNSNLKQMFTHFIKESDEMKRWRNEMC